MTGVADRGVPAFGSHADDDGPLSAGQFADPGSEFIALLAAQAEGFGDHGHHDPGGTPPEEPFDLDRQGIVVDRFVFVKGRLEDREDARQLAHKVRVFFGRIEPDMASTTKRELRGAGPVQEGEAAHPGRHPASEQAPRDVCSGAVAALLPPGKRVRGGRSRRADLSGHVDHGDRDLPARLQRSRRVRGRHRARQGGFDVLAEQSGGS